MKLVVGAAHLASALDVAAMAAAQTLDVEAPDPGAKLHNILLVSLLG